MKRNMWIYFTIAMIAMIIITSCATIVSRSSHPLRVTTDPKDAQISITDKKGKEIFKGTSGTSVTLKTGAGYFSRAEYQVKVTAPGHAEQIVPVTYKMNGWYFGNLLIGGVLGMLIVDPISGAMWKPMQTEMDVRLKKTTASLNAELKIIDVNTLSEKEKEGLVKLK